MQAASFGDDVEFLKQHGDLVVLKDAKGQAQVAISPGFQGRVMTSTATGSNGLSYGWINRELIAEQKPRAHINAYGGEDRFWLGPEGGQYSIFFKKDDPFDLEHWQTPAAIDSVTYPITRKRSDEVTFNYRTQLTNYSGTTFDVEINRVIRLLDATRIANELGVSAGATVKAVAFESENKLINKGRNAWTKETGLLSVWILGMFNPSPATTIVIPYFRGDDTKLGPVVNDTYFGKVPADRLVAKDGVIYFKGDGQARGKIGLSPNRALSKLGSYDAESGVLTIVQYTLPPNATEYVNSMWELQKEPYRGDVVNSYNDGPPTPGAKPLGPFYELETSSPAAQLKARGSLTHIHRTFHFQGPADDLDLITRVVLGVSLEQIQAALPKKTAATIKHSFLVTGGETKIVNGDGATIWTYPRSTRDGWVLANGNILLTVSQDKKDYPGGAVVEVDREGRVLWEFKGTQAEVNTSQLLPNGRIMLTEAGPNPRLLEVDRAGRIVVQFPIACQLTNFHMQSRMARKLANGNYLIPQLLDKVVREYAPDGNVVWEVKTPNWPFTAIRLPNGNTLINCTYGNVSLEVNPAGQTVWQLGNADLPEALIKDACGGQRLPNGNTVITSYGIGVKRTKLIEVTPDKQMVWSYTDNTPHGIHHFQILDTNGQPLAGPAWR
jgi:hypothetical protein